jgi:MoaA/NifB/PqqE/SkfB family radical SAM enzyme
MQNDIKSPLMGTVKYKKGRNFRKVLNDSLNVFFKDALRVTVKDPKQAFYFMQTVRWQRKAARIRSKLEQDGVHVPPILIFSITNKCNLHCKGCYHIALDRPSRPEMSVDKIWSTITEARELGISFMVIAGGEPLVRKEFIDITKDFPEIIFLVFTNGMLIDDDLIIKLKGQRNFIPVISLEGWQEDTDKRRGEGVYEHLQRIIERIKGIGLFWSVSLTVTRSNFNTIVDNQFIKFLIDLGCKLIFFVEYTPLKEGTEEWIITDDQRHRLLTLRDSFRSKYSALFVAIPGDEDEIGGCLSAGRGFIHVSAEGDIEPCPFIPYSDANLANLSLKDALQSEFLKTIRENHEQFSETEGGCALWTEREWVQSLLQKK